MKAINVLVVEDTQIYTEKMGIRDSHFHSVRAIYTDLVCSIDHGSGSEAACNHLLYKTHNCVPVFPMCFWQCARKEWLMSLSFK